MARIELTEVDLIEALLAAQQNQDDGGALTVADIVDQTGLSREAVRKRLHLLEMEQRLTVTRVARKCLDGLVRRVPGYRLSNGCLRQTDKRMDGG